MTQPFERWKVLPHGKLSAVEDDILTVTGSIEMPLMELPRRMTVVRLSDGRLVIWSAIALDEDEMGSLERYGRPAFLVVPNDHHRLDAKIWKKRYPDMQVVTPVGARDKVEETVHVDSVSSSFGDPRVEFITVPGTDEREAALLIRGEKGTTLVLNDLVANIRHKSGFGGWLLRVMGFAGDAPQVPAPVKMTLGKNKEILRAQLLQWAQLDGLKRIIVSHGVPIEERPAQILRDLAESLD